VVPSSIASVGTGIFIKKTGQYRPPIWFGLTFMTLGWGLFINFGAEANWAKIIMYQVIAGVGVGPNFQAPLIALQSLVQPRDIATATATFAFIRNLATSISVVIGGVIFQNEMASRAGTLRAALGDQTAAQLGGGNAGANVAVVEALPPGPQSVARQAFASSLSTMWILYTVIAFIGLLVSFLVGKQTLSKQHEQHKIGLEGEMQRKAENRRSKGSRAGAGDEESRPRTGHRRENSRPESKDTRITTASDGGDESKETAKEEV